jgi:hypothetical protein
MVVKNRIFILLFIIHFSIDRSLITARRAKLVSIVVDELRRQKVEYAILECAELLENR